MDNDHIPTEEIKLIKCPFCGEDDFDFVGLKMHLIKWCEEYKKTKIEW